MSKQQLNIHFERYARPDELPPSDRELFAAAIAAMESAYAPYSAFRVGAAIRLSNGEVVTGSNQENMAYPSGLCAERVAMFYAASKFPDARMETLAVTADHLSEGTDGTVSPCGGCRQVMVEYERRQATPLRIITGAANGPVLVTPDAAALMPFAFDDPRLGS